MVFPIRPLTGILYISAFRYRAFEPCRSFFLCRFGCVGRGNIFSFLERFILRFDFFGLYLQSRNESKRFPLRRFAEIAQLVEHNLAKVGVASSSLVFRSEVLFEGPFLLGKVTCIEAKILYVNVFNMPRTEPNLFELCRGEKTCMKMNDVLDCFVFCYGKRVPIKASCSYAPNCGT